MLGSSGAGKTTLLACMNRVFERVLPGSFFPADQSTFASLSKAYKQLEANTKTPGLEFGIAVEGTEDLREYAFTVKVHQGSISARFYDFPGG